MMEGEDLAKLLGKKHRYVILLEMYPAEKSYVTELASALDIDRRNLGRYLEGLQKADLVIFNEEKRMEGGKPYRYYCLTESGRKIVSVFTNVTTKVTKLKPEKWQIDKIIGLLKNEKLSANLREIAVHRFFSFCQEDPVYLTKDKKVKKMTRYERDYEHQYPHLFQDC
jgi:DNA-binding HxlR family transcriptional regulator